MRNPTRPPRVAIAFVLLLGAVACANGMSFTRTPSSPIRVTERQNDRTVTLRRGQQLQVVLHSTHWEFQRVTNSAVLRLEHPPKVRPKPSRCVTGGGCGTVTVAYLATAVGRAVVTAERKSCGEAMGCTAATGRFTIHVIVRRQ